MFAAKNAHQIQAEPSNVTHFHCKKKYGISEPFHWNFRHFRFRLITVAAIFLHVFCCSFYWMSLDFLSLTLVYLLIVQCTNERYKEKVRCTTTHTHRVKERKGAIFHQHIRKVFTRFWCISEWMRVIHFIENIFLYYILKSLMSVESKVGKHEYDDICSRWWWHWIYVGNAMIWTCTYYSLS